MLTDDCFLQNLINALKVVHQAIPDQMIGIHDRNYVALYCSKCFADALGVSVENLIGKIYWLDWKNQSSDVVVNEEKEVMEYRKTLAFLKINKFNNSFKPLICIKSPIINPDTDHVVGTMSQLLEYNLAPSFQQQMDNLYHTFLSKNKNKQVVPVRLSKREKQVIFFFLAHFSSQEIADILSQIDSKRVTKSTIDSIFKDQLYLKFNVNSRAALHKKLLDLGYTKFIPQDILTCSSTPLDIVTVY